MTVMNSQKHQPGRVAKYAPAKDKGAAAETPPAQPPASRRLGRLHLALFFFAVAGCLMWTLWLLVLTTDPNGMINRIMDTAAFDDGSFWLIIEPAQSLVLFGVTGLALVAGFYLFTLWRIAIAKQSAPMRVVPSTSSSRIKSATASMARTMGGVKGSMQESMARASEDPDRNVVIRSVAKLTTDVLMNADSSARKKAHVGVKVVDFGVQFVLLVQIMETGYPLALVVAFTLIISLNSLACAAMMLVQPSGHREMREAIVEIVFDFLVAVGFPMLVVIYCLSTFEFDRAKFAINMEIYPSGRFERLARVLADPVQMDVIDKSLNSLRIRTVLDFFTRVGTNLMFCLQLNRLLQLAQSHHATNKSKTSSLYPTRHPSATLFLLIPLLVCGFVYASTTTSESACSSHPECVVHARRWISIREGDLTQCPCLTLIAKDFIPPTFADYLDPPSITTQLGQLAATGDLQTVGIAHRELRVFPDELRRCTNLKHLSLYYTNTETMPEWMREFKKLEYLLLEGKIQWANVNSLPDALFDDMSSLAFIRLAAHTRIKRLPSFRGLTKLRTLSISAVVSLEELPAFSNLRSLEYVAISMVMSLKSMPDMAPLAKLKSFSLITRAALCCNGFLGAACNLNSSYCLLHPLTPFLPPTACLPANRTDHIATSATQETLLTRFASTVCRDYVGVPNVADDVLTAADMLKCNGTHYMECPKPGNRTGMCYAARLLPVSCNSNPWPIAMRRRQIQEGVGTPCNPAIEAWLGCTG